MENHLKYATEWLLEASNEIAEPFFQIPIAEGNSAFRERVYCYELYHQWRVKWKNDFPFILCGELDKRGHTLIKGKNLDSTIPDFLIHHPGDMSNLLVMEVKHANGDKGKMVGDLKKLTAYRKNLKDKYENPANYYAAYFLIYGLQKNEWPSFSKEIIEKIEDKGEVDLSLIQCFLHSSFNSKIEEVQWPKNG